MVKDHILSFYDSLKPDWKLPKGIELIYPFDQSTVRAIMDLFYSKYYGDNRRRTFLFGINPGRLGAGMTGVPFTDPIALDTHCGIANEIPKKHELSSIFIYEMITLMGGPEHFYSDFYISSLCPLGFVKDGKNYNYYDSKKLYGAVESHMIASIEVQISQYCNREVALSLGQGKNYKIFTSLNDKHQWFEKVIPLPHPRWVMQYKRKTKEVYLDEYLIKLQSVDKKN